MVREYRKRCNTVENIHKVIGSWDSVIFVRESEERTACPITKGSNNTQFHISLIFVLYFLSQFQRFLLFLMPFHTLAIQENAFCVESLYHKEYVSPAQRS